MHCLTNSQISRYSRQLLLPEIGVKGQSLLNDASVLVIGAGGLGCPAAIYLAASGVGSIGIVDDDDVEVNNLHRQILHSEGRVGTPKSASAALTCSQFDVVLDCTDNVPTRYLINDACVLENKPLISGSALKFEGQLTVYNYSGGPCYRCIFPKPPPAAAVGSCSDNGVLGVVPGIIGSLQALEVTKILCRIGPSYSQCMLLFDALSGEFRTVKLRGKRPECAVCGTNRTITSLVNYEQFCGVAATETCTNVSLLDSSQRISPKVYEKALVSKKPHALVDVRSQNELEICRLPEGAKVFMNVPISLLQNSQSQPANTNDQLTAACSTLSNNVRETPLSSLRSKLRSCCETNEGSTPFPVYVVCRRGNDSQVAVSILSTLLQDIPVTVQDIAGGLHAWHKDVDHNFPVY